MPCLEVLYLQFDLAGTGAQRLPCHGFEYSPRKTSEPPEEDDSEATAEIEWACLPPFEPDQTVLQAWQDTAVLLGRELSAEFRNPRASPSITVEEVKRHGEEHIELIAENSALMRADNESTA